MTKSTAPKPFVFTLMPFDKEFKNIYELGIKQAVNEAGGYCERVDEQQFEERITDRIYNQINVADVLVAEMTGRNPNVFYEVGYAHALERKVILLTNDNDAKNIPFDIKDYPHIIYSNHSDLKDKLAKKLQWFFDNPNMRMLSNFEQLHFSIKGQEISENATIMINEKDIAILKVEIQNNSNRTHDGHFNLGITLPKKFDINLRSRQKNFKQILKNGLYTILNDEYIDKLFPELITDCDFPLNYGNQLKWNSNVPITLIYYSDTETQKINFKLKFER